MIAPAVFADASFYTAVLNRGDNHHARAIAWQRTIIQAKTRMITTEAVLWELLNTFATPPVRALAIQSYKRLHVDSAVEIIGFLPDVCSSAVDLYAGRSDKSWGITDCFSFEVMQLHGLTDALTADHHFEQAGFAALLLRDPD